MCGESITVANSEGIEVSRVQKIRIRDGRFMDAQERHVILHGINLVNKSPAEGYLFDTGPELFAALREWGFNVVRFGVIWDGLEPEPGVYDEAYLARLDQHIAWAREAGLLVFLDMHQDLYSVLYSDGAPEWATLTDGAPHVDLGGVWSDAYFTSPAVQVALDNFWSNALAPDGIGLQDHYARMWAHLAQRYADEPAVIGYDIMNEPFPGSAGVQAQGAMFARAAELLATVAPSLGDSVEALMEQWLTAEGRFAILQHLRDVTLYTQIIDVTESIFAAFEKTQYLPHRPPPPTATSKSRQPAMYARGCSLSDKVMLLLWLVFKLPAVIWMVTAAGCSRHRQIDEGGVG